MKIFALDCNLPLQTKLSKNNSHDHMKPPSLPFSVYSLGHLSMNSSHNGNLIKTNIFLIKGMISYGSLERLALIANVPAAFS